MESKHLGLVIKTVERCNINCEYCYFFFSGDDSYKLHPPYIPTQTIEDIVKFIKRSSKEINLSHVTIGFHGGEPLMQKKDKFIEMCERFLSLSNELEKIEFTLQTNGLLIDDEWIEIFYKYKVYIGISIDGYKEVHDLFRKDKQGRGTYDKLAKKINYTLAHPLIKKMGGVGALAVINPQFSAKNIYRHFVDNLNLFYIDFLLPDFNRDTLLNVPASSYGAFLCELFDEWTNDNNPKIKIRILKNAIQAFQGINSEIYGYSKPNLEHLPLLTISSNGYLSPVDELRTADPNLMLTNANVSTASLKDIINLPIFEEIYNAQKKLPEKCQSCCWKKPCSGGGLVHRYSKINRFNNPSIYCDGLYNFYSHVSAYMLKNGYDINFMKENLFEH